MNDLRDRAFVVYCVLCFVNVFASNQKWSGVRSAVGDRLTSRLRRTALGGVCS